jgi:hypothetical protein
MAQARLPEEASADARPNERSFWMSLVQLLLTAITGMVILAASRVVRVHLGRAPHAEGGAKLLFILTLLFVPPIALGAMFNPTAGPLGWAVWVSAYAIILAGLTLLMRLVAPVVLSAAPRRSHRLLLLALVGSEGEPDAVAYDPPVTAKLAESMAAVDRTNGVFPRGVEFPAQIGRAGFRTEWDALDAATQTLEGRIADDIRLGLAVASAARITARDARSRLDTLQRLALDHGQAWAGI